MKTKNLLKKAFLLLALMGGASSAWADDVVIFSMSSVTNGKTSVPSGATQSITATFNDGSSAEVYNGHGSSAKEMISSSAEIKLGGSGSSYFHATFTTALAAGDVITSSTENTFYLSGTTTKGSSVTFPYTIKSTDTGLIGKTDLYVWKNSGNSFTSFTITRTTGTAKPTITQTGKTVTLECATDGATIYYTIDGLEPTTSSATYSSPINLDNSCTVRTFAKKGDDASDIVKKDCYVDHSSKTNFAVKLGYNGGTVSGDVWTSTDGEYILTNNVETRGINYANLAGSQDGFKLNHTDNYTLKVSNNIKVTKIVVVGKSWLQGSAGNAATIAIDGFTPASGSFYDYPTDGETYVNTVEFTPESELGYGASITLRPGNNQLGAYIEVYGTEYAPSATMFEDPVNWDFTNWSDATKADVLANAEKWNQYEKTGSGGADFGNNGRSNITALSNNTLTSTATISETDGLKFTAPAYGLGLMFNLPSTDIGTYHGNQFLWLYGNNSVITIPSVTKGSIIEIGVETHKTSEARGVTVSNSTQTQGEATSTSYQVCKWTVNTAGNITITPSKGLHIYYITLKKAVDCVAITPAKDKSTYVTTTALDFSDVAGLKAYVATAAAGGTVNLEEVDAAVPAGTPLMLVGTADTEYKVPVVAEASAPETNMFEAGDGTTVFNGSTFDYILYTDGLFYQIGSGSVPVGKAYLHCDSNPTTPLARELRISFGDNITGIDQIDNGQFSGW